MTDARQTMTEWHSLRLGLLFCYEGDVSIHGRGRHGILASTAWLIERGWARVTDESGIQVRAKAGEWLMARPGIRTQEFSADIRLLSINFRAAFHTGEHLFHDGLSAVLGADTYPDLERRGRKLQRMASRILGEGHAGAAGTGRAPLTLADYLGLQDTLLRWVVAWSGALTDFGLHPTTAYTNDPRVGHALAFVQEHVQDPDLNAAHVASAVGLSFSQLNRLFLRERDETIRQAIQRIRLGHANHLLTRSGHSIKEVALQLGFRHQSHFTAWFRKQTGRTPTEFRVEPMRARYFPTKAPPPRGDSRPQKPQGTRNRKNPPGDAAHGRLARSTRSPDQGS